MPELAQKSFLATQALYAAEQEMKLGKGKNNIRFYQYVQSFSPKDNITPEQAHSIGMQFVKEFFPQHEVLVATHLDNGQYHNHFVINATSFVDGSKLHMNKFSLAKMRRLNDEICAAHGLKVLEPYDPRQPSINLGQREYRAQQKGNSWKFELLGVITQLMKKCGSKKEFIRKLKEKGYTVRWEPQQKTMTYTCPNGMKVRDNKLHDARFLKEAMENEFRIREQYLEQIARLAETDSTGDKRDTVPADSLRYTQGPLGADAFTAWAADRVSGKAVPGNVPTAQGVTNCISYTMQDSEQTITRQNSEVKELLQQVGRSREEFTSRLSSQLSESRQEMLKTIDTLNKRLRIFSIAVLSISVVLSVLVWVLLSHLLK